MSYFSKGKCVRQQNSEGTTDRRLSVPYFLRITEVILVANGTMTMEARRRRTIRFEVVTGDAEYLT